VRVERYPSTHYVSITVYAQADWSVYTVYGNYAVIAIYRQLNNKQP